MSFYMVLSKIYLLKPVIVVTPVPVNYAKVINSGYSHISEPALELHSRAAPSVRGNITAQSVQPQGEIQEDGRRKKNLTVEKGGSEKPFYAMWHLMQCIPKLAVFLVLKMFCNSM